MKYISSRDKSISITWSQAVLQGISVDGGLFVPESFPKVENLKSLVNMNYKQLANIVMSQFFPGYDANDLKSCINKAYDKKFSLEEISPLVDVGGEYYLELFHGATLAFKDIALSILPYILKEAIKVNKEEKEIVILTATSGDTGKAALENFANVEGIKIIVFYPEEGVSNIQKLQMVTQEGANTFVVGVNGDFDDAQSGVKKILNDSYFIDVLESNNYRFSSANSINIGRLIPQIVYYFHSYLTLLREGKIAYDEKINFVVPTGNFGNILAGYYAKQMGLPINKLICASNENNVLTDFINTGIYDRRRELVLTSSPSMDILISSNLERLLFHLTKGDDLLIKDLMKQLSEVGYFKADNLCLDDFKANYSSEEEISLSIRKVFEQYNYLMDPHTAVASNVYEKYRLETGDNTKTVIISTASPFKFADKVASSIGIDTSNCDEFQILMEIEKKTNMNIPKEILKLKNKNIVHKNNCNKDEIKDMIKGYLKVGDIGD